MSPYADGGFDRVSWKPSLLPLGMVNQCLHKSLLSLLINLIFNLNGIIDFKLSIIEFKTSQNDLQFFSRYIHISIHTRTHKYTQLHDF